MALKWAESLCDLWGRTRDCFVCAGFGGEYQVGKIERDKELRSVVFLLDMYGRRDWDVCYRAVFKPLHISEEYSSKDIECQRWSESSDFFPTLEEAKQWCRDFEDAYREQRNAVFRRQAGDKLAR
jgi:hypothetical protein